MNTRQLERMAGISPPQLAPIEVRFRIYYLLRQRSTRDCPTTTTRSCIPSRTISQWKCHVTKEENGCHTIQTKERNLCNERRQALLYWSSHPLHVNQRQQAEERGGTASPAASSLFSSLALTNGPLRVLVRFCTGLCPGEVAYRLNGFCAMLDWAVASLSAVETLYPHWNG